MQVKVTFQTPGPLSQNAGREFWTHGSHFTSTPGRHTYQFTTALDASSLIDAINGVVALIEKIVRDEGFHWDGVVIKDINASSEGE